MERLEERYLMDVRSGQGNAMVPDKARNTEKEIKGKGRNKGVGV